jgi:hypothetical protein
VIIGLVAAALALSLSACGQSHGRGYSPNIAEIRSPGVFVGHTFDLPPRSVFLAAPTAQGMWDYETECLRLKQESGGRVPNNDYKEKCGIVNLFASKFSSENSFSPRSPVRVLVIDFAKPDTNASLIRVKIQIPNCGTGAFWIPARYLLRAVEVN